MSSKISLSKRNELEITDLINQYVNSSIKEVKLTRGVTWFDTGTFDDLLNASNFIQIIEQKQGQKIGCIEESAFKGKFLNIKNFKHLIRNTANIDLKKYLKKIIHNQFD